VVKGDVVERPCRLPSAAAVHLSQSVGYTLPFGLLLLSAGSGSLMRMIFSGRLFARLATDRR
jgi:hypothetical protein